MQQKQGRTAYRNQIAAEFDALFPPHLFQQVPQHGNTEWNPRMVLWISMIMYWLPDKTLTERFSSARRYVKKIKPHWKIPTSFSGFVAAQSRYWSLINSLLISRLRPDETMLQDCLICGWLVLAVDGSRFECPRTTANEEGLGCAGKDKTKPQIFQTLLQHVGTGLPWSFRLGPGTDSERHHLDQMLAELPEKTLLTADAGFISYRLCAELIRLNRPFVLRIGGNKTLIENLAEDDSGNGNIVYFWPKKEHNQPPLKLRRICFDSPCGLPVVLMTNILDEQVLSDEDAQSIYRSRWGIEVYFRHIKQTMDLACLNSRTPATSLSEQGWRFVSFWMLQRVFVAHQIEGGKNPLRFSAANARREIREVLQLMLAGSCGRALKNRCLGSQQDEYKRRGKKVTRDYPRKKVDRPPKPPKIRAATKQEIETAQRVGLLFLTI